MKKLIAPKGLVINFSPSERQLEMWNALQPNRCDRCGGHLIMKHTHNDEKGYPVYEPTCESCGNTDIPERVLAGGSAGGGKALLLNELCLTPEGFVQVKDLKLGQTISSPVTGQEQKIIWLHPIEKHPYYKINFDDGTSCTCSEGHLWNIRRSYNGVLERDESIWTTSAIDKYYKEEKNHPYTKLSIPLCKSMNIHKPFMMGQRTIDPYMLGILISEGDFEKCADDTARFSLVNEACLYGHFINGYKVTRLTGYGNDTGRKSYLYSGEGLTKRLENLGLAGLNSKNVRIPQPYIFAPLIVRVSLITALMDSDGYTGIDGALYYETFSKQLADDFAFIIRSIGGWARVCECDCRTRDGVDIINEKAYRVRFMTDMDSNFFSSADSIDKFNAMVKYRNPNVTLAKTIESVEYVGIQEGRCITVSDPEGLFVTNDFTVTHNSFLGCAWLIQSCISYPDMLFVVARKTLKVLKSTTWKTLLRLLKSWGFKEDVHYHINNQEGTLTFWNGSVIMQMELAPSLQDPDFNNLGSLEISGAFIDEVSEISEKAVEVLGSRIRYKIADTFVVGKILMSTNPCATWVRSTFVQDDDGEPVELAKGDRFIRFSLFDNPDEKFRQIYFNKLKKIRDKATRDRLLYGNWDFFNMNEMAAYWNFDGEKHLVSKLKEKYYDPGKPLILALDFNVNPYMTCEPCQIDFEKKEVYFFPEYIGRPADKKLGTKAVNNTPAFSRFIASELVKDRHYGGIILTGDPAGKARSTQTEEGTNNFTIAEKILYSNGFRPKTETFAKQPAQITRLDFVNEMLNGYEGWKIFIDVRSRRLTDDLVNQKKNPDGTKEKKKIINDNGERVEKYGHASDCFDYILTYFCPKEYAKFKRGENGMVVVTVGRDDQVYDLFGGY